MPALFHTSAVVEFTFLAGHFRLPWTRTGLLLPACARVGSGMDRYRVPGNRITGLVTLTSKSPESRPKIVFRKCVEAEGGVVMDSMTIRIDMAGRHIVGGGVGSMDPDLFAACLDAIPHELEQ